MPKPAKPHSDYPLFAHASGQWAKKVNRKLHYFGVWADPQAALQKYLKEKDYLLAGQVPPVKATKLADILNAFLGVKQRAIETDELTQQTYVDYEAVCDTIAKTIGKRRTIESIGFDELDRVRTALSKGTKGQKISPVSHKRLLTIARMVFKHANDELGVTVRYTKALRTPPARLIRKARNEKGRQLFTSEEINRSIEAANPQLKAMILLGINCGFGNADCGTLPIETLDLKNGWHNYWRPKTQVPRRCPLWPETVEAIQKVKGERNEGLLFTTKYGNSWTKEGSQCPISFEFRKLANDLGIYQKGVKTFYTLRRTFETIGSAAEVNQAVIDSIMGHAPDANDMGSIYRQVVFDKSLRRCTDFVRDWLNGSISLE